MWAEVMSMSARGPVRLGDRRRGCASPSPRAAPSLTRSQGLIAVGEMRHGGSVAGDAVRNAQCAIRSRACCLLLVLSLRWARGEGGRGECRFSGSLSAIRSLPTNCESRNPGRTANCALRQSRPQPQRPLPLNYIRVIHGGVPMVLAPAITRVTHRTAATTAASIHLHYEGAVVETPLAGFTGVVAISTGWRWWRPSRGSGRVVPRMPSRILAATGAGLAGSVAGTGWKVAVLVPAGRMGEAHRALRGIAGHAAAVVGRRGWREVRGTRSTLTASCRFRCSPRRSSPSSGISIAP